MTFHKHRKYVFSFLVFFIPLSLFSQQKTAYKYVNGATLTLLGKSETISSETYKRISIKDLKELPKRVQELAANSAGINLMFQTNSKSIKVNWEVDEYRILWNMSPLAVNGLDLYGWNGISWQYVSSARPTDSTNSAVFIKNLDGKLRHYRIYLPLYTGLENIEIGVEENALIKTANKSFVPAIKVAIYGSSITQGASASRPGMAYPAILSRDFDMETYNLGFSGSGKMELKMAEILGQMDVDCYVLDCVPNPSPAQIKERTVPFVKKLRSLKSNTPIVMVESIFREKGNWDSKLGQRVNQQNQEFNKAYQKLHEAGYTNIYYIPSDGLMADDHEATVDGTHLTDLGQSRLSDRIGREIEQILMND